MQLGCAPGSTLTSIIIVPALPGILMVTSVMIWDLSSGSVSVYSPSKGLLLALVPWDILLCTAKQENLLYIPSSSGPEGTVFDDTLPCFSLSPPDVVVTSDGTEFLNVTAYAFCFGGFFGVFFWCWRLPPPLPWPLLLPVEPCLCGCGFFLWWGLCPVLAITLERQTALKWLIPLHLSQVFPYLGQLPRSWDLPHLPQHWPLLPRPLGHLLDNAWADSNGLL